jgi:D-aminoacyl-tRNA deacylase
MRIVIQRVKEASVTIDNKVVGEIGAGALVLFGVAQGDDKSHVKWIANKLINLRMFADSNDKMNLSLQDINGSVLIVSQFTLYADCSAGRRPSFTKSAPPEIARSLYEDFVVEVKKEIPKKVQTGVFGGKMQVKLINDGPVTFIIDNK